MQSPSPFIPIPCVLVLTKRPGGDQQLLQPETLKGKALKIEQGHLISFEVAPQGNQAGSGEMKEQKEASLTKILCPLTPFPSYP